MTDRDECLYVGDAQTPEELLSQNSPKERRQEDRRKTPAPYGGPRGGRRLRDRRAADRAPSPKGREEELRDKLATSIHARCLRWTSDDPPCEACYADADRYIKWVRTHSPDGDPTSHLVTHFAQAVLAKLRKAEEKYGYTTEWRDSPNLRGMQVELLQHVEKGDPRDVAAYCAFLWYHGESTTPQEEDDD